MDSTAESRQVPVEDGGWWTSVDEGYWQALLEQGEIAPELTLPAEPLKAFQGSRVETQEVPPSGQPIIEGTTISGGDHG